MSAAAAEGIGGVPSVSVVIPCYNHARFLRAAVDSALEQTRPADEIIVVDDGSTDETPEVARRFGNRIGYVRQDNRGLAAARNTGIRQARGELVALLDSDDLWLPTFLETMASLIAHRPGAALYYSGWRHMDVDGHAVASWGPPRDVPPQDVYQALLRADFLVPSAVVLRRTVAVEAGLFDASLRWQEDWDLWLRLAQRWPVAGTSAPLVRYRLTPNSLSANFDAMAAATFRVVEKLFGPAHAPPVTWTADKRRAYGGAGRFCAIESLRRTGDPSACARFLGRAVAADPTLATDLDLWFELAVAGQSGDDRGRFDRLDFDAAAVTVSSVMEATFASAAGIVALERPRRDTFGTAFFALGLVAYGCGRTADARRSFRTALRYTPGILLHRQFLPALVRTCAGGRLMSYLRAWRARRVSGGALP